MRQLSDRALRGRVGEGLDSGEGSRFGEKAATTTPVSIGSMYSPRPGYVPRSRFVRLVGLALFTLCLGGLGTYLLHYAIEGWSQGAISITKGGRVNTATRAGDHWLLFYVWVTYSVTAGVYGFITRLPRQADE
jgi:hypothetical protein